MKNVIDLLRVIPCIGSDTSDDPSSNVTVDTQTFLVQSHQWGSGSGKNAEVDNELSDDSEEESNNTKTVKEVVKKRKINTIAGGSAKMSKTETTEGNTKATRSTKKTLDQQLVDVHAHRNVFTNAWLALFSLPLTKYQLRLTLQHLPSHVLPYMTKPLLLADFLSKTFDKGGVISILALESLFLVIIKHNLDYPNYFTSLYNMCTFDILCAKYRHKFMTLLSSSLKTTNLPVYVAAAFIKKLAYLALHVTGPSALYCIAQATWLMRRHQQCLSLIHKVPTAEGKEIDQFDMNKSLEECAAMTSSLYEVELLQNHFLFSVSAMATALQNNHVTTASNTDAPELIVSDFIHQSYSEITESELKKSKKNAPLQHKKPSGLFSDSDMVGRCFGI